MPSLRTFPLRPIRSEAELDRAIGVANALLDRDDLAAAEEDYLDVLGDLIRKYESGRHPKVPVPPREMLAHFLDAHRASPGDLARATGVDEATIAGVLDGSIDWDLAQVTTLARHFGVSPAVFLDA